jgi:hypothetical protein
MLIHVNSATPSTLAAWGFAQHTPGDKAFFVYIRPHSYTQDIGCS